MARKVGDTLTFFLGALVGLCEQVAHTTTQLVEKARDAGLGKVPLDGLARQQFLHGELFMKEVQANSNAILLQEIFGYFMADLMAE